MPKHVEAGKPCRVIGADGGPQSLNIGKVVIPEFRHELEHTLWGPIWHCHTADGSIVATVHGSATSEADFAEDWLEPIDEEDLKKTEEEKKEVGA